nr:ribonuclease H-like domain, reverse transcriptase, RNA-dependent DNA polymerase [Tanacetum cinerariifolium]
DHGKKVGKDPRQESECKDQEKEDNVNNTNNVNATGSNEVNTVDANTNNELLFDLEIHALEDISTFNFSSNHEDDDEMADMNYLDTIIQVSPNTTTRIHRDHPLDQVTRDLHSTTKTRHMSKNLEEHRLFLAYASFKDFVVYQMDVKSAFLYEKIEEDVYVCQPPGFEDPNFSDKVYKVEKVLYGLHQAPKACVCMYKQVNLKVSYLYDVKRIFRYLKGKPKFSLWYLKDSPFDLVAYTDSDYAGASLDKKYTTGGC